jgi:hypothetical protein
MTHKNGNGQKDGSYVRDQLGRRKGEENKDKKDPCQKKAFF